jgi:hypothetical protein
MKVINIDGLTITENFEITTNEATLSVTSKITDAEHDELNLEFHYDETIVIDTQNFKHISLTLENLKELIKLVEKSEEIFEDYWCHKLETKYLNFLNIDSKDKK